MGWQPAGIVWPDAELLLTTSLRSMLAARPEPHAQGVLVSNRVPDVRRDRMVVVRRDGGTPTRERDRPRMSLQVWGRTDQEAADLARLTQALLSTLPGQSGVLHVEHLSGPADVPDESGQPRRYLVSEIHVRGVPL